MFFAFASLEVNCIFWRHVQIMDMESNNPENSISLRKASFEDTLKIGNLALSPSIMILF